ncbi:MAG TPA: CocE/NonD family hydrolase [Candidatus Thermoplasmatota archaeon]|nr:CocE/NonD family hydrolase [Candidatus Thermoplasmatota archaeon]
MQKAWLVAFVLTAGVLAGCTGSKSGGTDPAATHGPDLTVLSPAKYAIKDPEEVWIPSGVDGKRLNNAVYRPDTTEKVPVFINFSPYHGDQAMTRDDNFAKYMISEYVPRGYAVVLSSVRGTGHSEGCFQVGGDLELKDSRDVVDFFSKQSWSTGSIGAGGKSYDSTTQNGLVAKFPHPALKTLFHVSGITDMYRYNGKDGVTYTNGLSFTPRYAVGEGTEEYGSPAGVGSGGSEDEDAQSLARLIDDVGCPELAKHVQSGEGTAASGIKDTYWQERDWTRYLPQSEWKGSIFFVHGLQDWNVKPDHIDPWVDIVQQKGLQVKGWLHQETGNGGHLYPMRTDWNVTMLRWLDHYLKGIGTGIDRELGFDVMGSDKVWRHSAAWPPASQETVVPGVSSGAAATPLFTLTLPNATSTIRLSGVPHAKVTVVPASPDPILHLNLYDVGDGNRTWVNEAVKRPALKDDLSGPSAYTPGLPTTFDLLFFPMDRELRPGHHLEVTTGFDSATETSTGTNADFVYTPSQNGATVYQKVDLHLPVVAPGGELSPQPVRMTCFAC